jgi:hypothetical protein
LWFTAQSDRVECVLRILYQIFKLLHGQNFVFIISLVYTILRRNKSRGAAAALVAPSVGKNYHFVGENNICLWCWWFACPMLYQLRGWYFGTQFSFFDIKLFLWSWIRVLSIDILYTLDSASLLVKLKPRIFQRLPPFE